MEFPNLNLLNWLWNHVIYKISKFDGILKYENLSQKNTPKLPKSRDLLNLISKSREDKPFALSSWIDLLA